MDGKQPGHVLLLALVSRLPGDPLILGRLLSIGAGLMTFFATMAIAKRFVPRVSPWIMATVLTFCPYLLFFDRMALAESFVTAATTLLLLLVLKVREMNFAITKTILYGILIGVLLGIGWWIKSSILLILPLLFFANLIIFFTALGTLCIFLLPILINPELLTLISSQQRYFLSLHNILRFPIALWASNLWHAIVWLFAYTTPIVFLFFCIGVVSSWKKPEWRIVLAWALFPVLAGSILASGFTARYMAIVVPGVLIMSLKGLEILKEIYGNKILALLLAPIIWSIVLIVSPLTYYKSLAFAPAAQKDFSQYVVRWTSGYGVKEAITWLEKRSEESPIAVGIRQDSGNPEDAAVLYLFGNPNITFFSVATPALNTGDGALNPPPDLALIGQKTNGLLTYFITRGKQFAGLEAYLTEVAHFKKPLGDEFVGIYRVDVRMLSIDKL